MVVVAVLAIFAVAVTAATIESTVVPERSGPEGPAGSGGGGDGGGLGPPPSGQSPGETLQIPFLTEILIVLAALVALALLAYLYMYWRSVLKAVVVASVAVGLVVLLVRLLGSSSGTWLPPAMEPANVSLGGGGGGDGGGSGQSDQPSLPGLLLLLVLIAGLVGTVVAYLRTSSASDESSSSSSQQREVDPMAVGDAAGRAADRLEEAETGVDNEVYRAWREMTDLLDVPNPETSTPGDFATAAVEAGMDSDDVQELTRVFEDVRYGDASPSPDREQRAIDSFRRIEARYSEDEA